MLNVVFRTATRAADGTSLYVKIDTSDNDEYDRVPIHTATVFGLALVGGAFKCFPPMPRQAAVGGEKMEIVPVAVSPGESMPRS